jgi:MFS transporter, MHS family, proline/betaine transporter
LIIAWIIKVTSNNMVPAYYLMTACLIGVVAMVFVKDTSGKALRGSAPAVEEKHEIPDILEEPKEALWWKDEKINIDKKIEEAESEQE